MLPFAVQGRDLRLPRTVSALLHFQDLSLALDSRDSKDGQAIKRPTREIMQALCHPLPTLV